MLKCPIYNDFNACAVNSNCLFLRNGGCAIILAATISEENSKLIKVLSQQLNNIEYTLTHLINVLNK